MRLLLQLCLMLTMCLPANIAAGQVTVFAASSLQDALRVINQDYKAPVSTSFASSAALARQIQHGAPADIFISANQSWMQVLEDQKLIVRDTKTDLFANQLVLVSAKTIESIELTDLPDRLTDGHIAMGRVNSVPAGIYAKQALTELGLWAQVEGKVVQTDHVRAALRLVLLKEVDFAVVYATDAHSAPDLSIVASIPSKLHDPIIYPAAQITDTPEAKAYFEYLTSPGALKVFQSFGFLKVEQE